MKGDCACKLLELGAEVMESVVRMERWQQQNYEIIVKGLSKKEARKELDTRWLNEIVNPYHRAIAQKIREANDACGTKLDKPEDQPPEVFVDEPQCYPQELLTSLCKQLKELPSEEE